VLHPAHYETPDGRSGLLSGWWRRVGAELIDGLVLVVPTLALQLLTGGLITHTSSHTTVRLGLGSVWQGEVCWAIYVLLMLPRTGAGNGQTVGKRVAGIRVVRDDGRPVDLRVAVVRDVICRTLVSCLAFVPAVGILFGLFELLDVLWPLWDSQNRALHDHIARTHVVRDP
jgi:uncharacterized RDD family membrane protein YckC